MKFDKKFNLIILACVFMGMSCSTRSNNSSNNGDTNDGEYEITETKECENCHGKGVVNIPCSRCGGTGRIDQQYYQEGTVRVPCSSCGGTGGFVCTHCNGTNRHNCEECSGRGQRRCDICHGRCTISMPGIGITSCPTCSGSGMITCFHCNGRRILECGYCTDGKVMCKVCWGNGYRNASASESGTRQIECEQCEGEKYFKKECEECNGDGEITVVKVFDSKTNQLLRENVINR